MYLCQILFVVTVKVIVLFSIFSALFRKLFILSILEGIPSYLPKIPNSFCILLSVYDLIDRRFGFDITSECE